MLFLDILVARSWADVAFFVSSINCCVFSWLSVLAIGIVEGFDALGMSTDVLDVLEV